MIVFAVLFVIAGFRAYEIFSYIFQPNVKGNTVLLIPTDTDYDQLENILEEEQIIENIKAFRWVAKKKKYKSNIKPGRYDLKKDWNTNELVNLLRIGEQSPVMVTFNNLRFTEDLAGKVSRYFEQDSLDFLQVFENETVMEKYGFDQHTFHAMFIPNSYEMYWTTTPLAFLERMHREYVKFWNAERLKKADSLGLNPTEVSTLASIVQEETVKEEEKARIAGLYINRLKRGMLLQADPTIKYALHDFSIRRITNKMLEVNSAYNTYKFRGLPPGPINFPEISSIEAVLNAEHHNYLYMCAKEDFSGYHRFAKTLSQHNINAAKYRRALNQNKIWR